MEGVSIKNATASEYKNLFNCFTDPFLIQFSPKRSPTHTSFSLNPNLVHQVSLYLRTMDPEAQAKVVLKGVDRSGFPDAGPAAQPWKSFPKSTLKTSSQTSAVIVTRGTLQYGVGSTIG